MRLLWLMVVFTLGCAKRQGPIMPEIIGDPDVVVSLARSRNKVDVLQGRFSLKLQTGEGSYTVPAAIVMDHPDRFRFELYTPLGTPLATLTSDGDALHESSNGTDTRRMLTASCKHARSGVCMRRLVWAIASRAAAA